ncbi:hypothetical protein ACEWY4_014141 [Coilia grayii]|uniref:E-selectin n=1 Tax=Coilia grayii TaxID=363190 RepID=A0ABD1JRF4_9TELE
MIEIFFCASQELFCVTICNQRMNVCLILTALVFSILAGWHEVAGWSYHYSEDRMDWDKARAWCKAKYTDMVAIQNKGEIKHLNDILPEKKGYYWIGIRKLNGSWTWVGTNKTLTSEAENWAQYEPNNAHKNGNEDCVEIYIKRQKDTGKWNDISCKQQKTALCYTASCDNNSCSGNGECVETINNHTCECFEGFYGKKCEHVVQCASEKIATPPNGSFRCSHPHGNFSYGSECTYSCQPGYELSSSGTLRCTASADWSSAPPTCEVVECEELVRPDKGSMSCSAPLGDFSYMSVCQFTCDEGYTLTDSLSATLSCGASGWWNGMQPKCEAVRCPVVGAPQHGHMSCEGNPSAPSSYPSQCQFTCEDGYHMSGVSAIRCTASGQWTDQPPLCEAITCPRPESPHLLSNCSTSLENQHIGSTCAFSCTSGFRLQGEPSVQCGETGRWSSQTPTCEEVECPPLEPPTAGSVSCTGLSRGAVCHISCSEGFVLQGEPRAVCVDSAEWSVDGETPTCNAVHCPAIEAPQYGQISCNKDVSASSSYPNQCSFTCEDGFHMIGVSAISCTASGQWTHQAPLCEAVRCPAIEAPQYGQISCNKDVSASSSYPNQCSFTCEDGFHMIGVSAISCTTSGQWTHQPPLCEAVHCPAVEAPQYGQISCNKDVSASSSYPNQCSFTCEDGFHMIGVSAISCTTSGMWTHQPPLCEAVRCPAIEAPQYGQISCNKDASASSSYPNQCSFTCEDGFHMIGVSAISCTTSGQWTHQPPLCEAVRCPQIQTSSDSKMNCSGGIDGQEGTYAASCTFSCHEGFLLHGNHTMMCSQHGNWTGEVPECQAPPERLINPTTIMMAAGGATSLSALFLISWLLRRMQQKGNKFDLNSTIDKEEPPQFYRNSTDCLI